MKRLLFILFLLLTSSNCYGATITRYVNPDSAGGNGTTAALTGANAAYASLNAFEAAEDADLTDSGGDIMVCNCATEGTADTTAVTIAGWTTSATCYIEIAGDFVGAKYDATKYYLNTSATANTTSIASAQSWTRLDIRIHNIQVLTDDGHCIGDTGALINNGCEVYVYNNLLIRISGWDLNYLSGVSIKLYRSAVGNNIYIWNNVILGCTSNNAVAYAGMGIEVSGNQAASCWLENNTIDRAGQGAIYGSGINVGTSVTAEAINNIIRGYTWKPIMGTFVADTDYNATDHSTLNYTVTGGGNTHDHLDHTFTFVDGSNADLTLRDYHLDSDDVGAMDLGTSGVNNSFSDDIDGVTRSGTWDIGADEYVSAVTARRMFLTQ